jgi:hypothetical protein
VRAKRSLDDGVVPAVAASGWRGSLILIRTASDWGQCYGSSRDNPKSATKVTGAYANQMYSPFVRG